MKKYGKCRRALVFGAAFALVFGTAGFLGVSSAQAAKAPIKIGVLAPFSAIDGISIVNAAELATDEINAHGGIDGHKIILLKYDDHASAADAVRAFQRAVKSDHVVAMIGSFLSEVSLAVEPWAARMHEPFIVTGGASDAITKLVREHSAQYKYVFQLMLNSTFLADGVCTQARDILVKDFHYKTCVVMSENADWTQPLDAEYMKCLPKAGLKVLDHIRFSPDTTDFTPIFNKIESTHADVIITGIAHVGVKPTVQWHAHQVPLLLAGWSSQAGASTFWKDTNGATEGVITSNMGAPGAAVTPKSNPFTTAYINRFKTTPAYNSYTSFDAVYVLKDAIERAHSTEPEALVGALAKTNYVGVLGREQFYGPKAQYAHGMKFGKDYVTGVAIQWQNGKQEILLPAHAATAKPILPKWLHVKK